MMYDTIHDLGQLLPKSARKILGKFLGLFIDYFKEKHTLDNYRKFVKPGNTVFDVGANIG